MKNIELKGKEGLAIISVNPELYSLEVVYSAAYVFLDKAYFFLDGDPKKDIKVFLKAKNEKLNEKELEKLAREFGNELVNYSVYIAQAARNQGVREAIIRRALATNVGEEYCPECNEDPALKEAAEKIKMKEDEDLYLKDPAGIADPWTEEKSEKFNKSKEKK